MKFSNMILALALIAPATTMALPRHFVVYTVVDQWNYIDLGESGRSLGDLVSGRGTLTKMPGRSPTGQYQWGATVVQLLPNDQEMRQSVVQFEWGTDAILASKIFQVPSHSNPVQPIVYAITGGTGRYASARGTVLFEPTGASTFKATFRLQ